MSTRYTDKDARNCAKRLADLLGKPFEPCFTKKDGKIEWTLGCWDVDYAPEYGGCMVKEISNDHGGVSLPFGEGRLAPYPFCRAMRIAEDAVRIDRERVKFY